MAPNIPSGYTFNNLTALSSESTPPQRHPAPTPSFSFFGRLEPVPVWKPTLARSPRPPRQPRTMAAIIPSPFPSQPHQASRLTLSQFAISPAPVPKPSSCAETLSLYQGILDMALSPNIPLHHSCLSRLEAGITELEDPNREVGIDKVPKRIVHTAVTNVHKLLLDDDEVRMMGESLAHDRRPDDALVQDVEIAEATLISLKYVYEALTGPGTKLREDCGKCVWETFDEVSGYSGTEGMDDGEDGLTRGAFREKLRMTLVGLSRIWGEWEQHVKILRGKAKEKASDQPAIQFGQDIEMADASAPVPQEQSGLGKGTKANPSLEVQNEEVIDLESILSTQRGRSKSVDSILGAPRDPIVPEPPVEECLRRGSRLRKPTTKATLTTEGAVGAEYLPANVNLGKGEKKKKRGPKKGSTAKVRATNRAR
ncbi:hypothetical protein BCR34DRAFT_568139 [Clohesyomyces aquaticus]|uniref:Uncharacterized protein n=1 Tax=Clohesyomyces aquaticus TaxID=1231657 RepID=A0A1Y1ZHT9_9PLEO|nr:hypothetical protein BCR34DRAFT_568139 [Clohesyomyces aquaticus]